MTVKKTFATLMPDKAGAFLEAAKVFSSLGLNITRVSYNKAVDTHMLFVEVCGESGAMNKAESELYGMGFLGHDGRRTRERYASSSLSCVTFRERLSRYSGLSNAAISTYPI